MENRTLKNRLVLNWNVGMAAVVVLLLAAAAWFWLFFGARVPVPTYSETIKNFRTSDGILVDRRGDPLFGIRIDFKSRKLPWTGLGEISPALKSAVVAVEDRRFFNHPGVDFSAASVAFLRWLIPGMGGESLRGASTITMQTVSVLDMDTPVLVGGRHGRRSLLQKYQQIKSALALDWDNSSDTVRSLFVAGNETIHQGPLKAESLKDLMKQLLIPVNTIFAGSADDAVFQEWQKLATDLDGSSGNIDPSLQIPDIKSPYDQKLIDLNEAFNKTIIFFGSNGIICSAI